MFLRRLASAYRGGWAGALDPWRHGLASRQSVVLADSKAVGAAGAARAVKRNRCPSRVPAGRPAFPHAPRDGPLGVAAGATAVPQALRRGAGHRLA